MSQKHETRCHADICIAFELGGQQFEAVGFLKDEDYVAGSEAVRRVDNGHVVKTDEDWQLIYQNRQDLPPELNNFWLATARSVPVGPRGVSYLYWVGDGWRGDWHGLGGEWDRDVLVLRRRV